MYVRVCRNENRHMSSEQTVSTITSVFGPIPPHYDEFDYRGIDVVRKMWISHVSDITKEKWKKRALLLNVRPKTGQFHVLPFYKTSLSDVIRKSLEADT